MARFSREQVEQQLRDELQRAGLARQSPDRRLFKAVSITPIHRTLHLPVHWLGLRPMPNPISGCGINR